MGAGGRHCLVGIVIRMVSAIGDAFLEDTDGKIYWLDVGGARLQCIAENWEQFDMLRQQRKQADEWFAPLLVGDLLKAGNTLAPNKCFSYKIPLTLGGGFSVDNFEACDLSVHFNVLGSIQRQVKDLPIGTKITSVVVED